MCKIFAKLRKKKLSCENVRKYVGKTLDAWYKPNNPGAHTPARPAIRAPTICAPNHPCQGGTPSLHLHRMLGSTDPTDATRHDLTIAGVSIDPSSYSSPNVTLSRKVALSTQGTWAQ